MLPTSAIVLWPARPPPTLLDLAAKADMQGKVTVELDSSPNMPIPAGETAKIAKVYLQKLGCEFRS